MSDAGTARTWATAINDSLKGGKDGCGRGRASGPGRRLLVLINPVSGTGDSRPKWNKILRSDVAYRSGGVSRCLVCSPLLSRTREGGKLPLKSVWRARSTSALSSSNYFSVFVPVMAFPDHAIDQALRALNPRQKHTRILVSKTKKINRPMLEQSSTSFTAIFSSRGGELAELVTGAGGAACAPDAAVEEGRGSGGDRQGQGRGQDAGGSRVGSLDDFDGIVVVGGDGTFFEVP